jgi:hypothetical protein
MNRRGLLIRVAKAADRPLLPFGFSGNADLFKMQNVCVFSQDGGHILRIYQKSRVLNDFFAPN